ncbi:MAG: hypothetical protein Q9195_001339 [Heterodermia aff. obscurata]
MAHPLSPQNHSRSASTGPSSPAPDDALSSPNPTSTLLKDMLRDKKAENRRLSRNFDSISSRKAASISGLGEREAQSSPIPSSASVRGRVKHGRQSSALGGMATSNPKEMGVREIEEHVSKLNKQNFDLKLELYQRRQRDEEIESQLKKIKTLEAEHAEVRKLNDNLVQELELRDAAIKEAVAIICDLEAKIEGGDLQKHLMYNHRLESDGAQSHTDTPSHDAGEASKIPPPFQSQSSEGQRSPLQRPQWSGSHVNQPTESVARTPSFLRDKKPSTSALRSIYQSEGNPSYMSLNRAGSPIRSNDPDYQALNSPRLSILSESSLPSIYDRLPRAFGSFDDSEAALTNYEAPNRFTFGEFDIAKERTPENSSLHQPDFIIDNNLGHSSQGRVNPSQNRIKPRHDASSDSVSDQSFKDRLEHLSADQDSNTPSGRERETSRWLNQSMSGDETSPLQQRIRRRRPSKASRKSVDAARDGKFSTISEVLHETQGQKLAKIPPLTSLGGSGFSGPNILPPTPDTMSTQKEANSSTQSIVTEKSLGDKARFPARKVSAMIPDDRPHTAGTLDTEYEKYVDESDAERKSVQAPQSEAHTDAFVKESVQPSFPFMSGASSPKTIQMINRTPVRPSLKSYATNIMFDGDGFDEVQPSRGMSYPSPKESRRRSAVYTPARRDHARTASGQVRTSTNYAVDSSATPILTSPAATPSKPSPLKSSPLKPSTSHEPSISSSQGRDDETVASGISIKSKIPRQSTIRQGFDNLKNFKNSFRRNLSYSGTGAPPVGEANTTSKGTDQSPSRIVRPGTSSGEANDAARSFSGPKIARSASLRIKGPGGGGKRG